MGDDDVDLLCVVWRKDRVGGGQAADLARLVLLSSDSFPPILIFSTCHFLQGIEKTIERAESASIR
ncbi:hypothetical protein COLO4_13243 [Corchorus olitorius]|uniref:Uncharacterized protein n=1 Tax=Corchorus olitorius TaxID=93759 RepID=A0A1R3JXH8_9ROSI|nr:hypothetical protein COLO4_13243 [Corchorus olitorius]